MSGKQLLQGAQMPEARLHEGSAFLIKGSLQLLLELGTHQLDIPAPQCPYSTWNLYT